MSFSFQTNLLHIESGQQTWYHSYSNIHTYSSQFRSLLSCVGKVLPHIAQMTFQLGGQPKVDLLTFSHAYQCQHYYPFENLLPLGTLVACFKPFLEYQASYEFPSPAVVPLGLSSFWKNM